MQKLVFEPSWDRALSQRDRVEIERIFTDLNHENKAGQQMVPLRTAFNHKHEFLVTVLVNNYSDVSFSLLGKNVQYKEGTGTISEMTSPYTFEVPAHTSMPWTFIFPKKTLKSEPSEKSGELIII
jgi:SLAP domain-containing protein